MPKIAVTVDLLTTGVDVVKITNLVFVRRVNSRILYEQMIGRATRLCPEIGDSDHVKALFRSHAEGDVSASTRLLCRSPPKPPGRAHEIRPGLPIWSISGNKQHAA
jgi:superfamily II DNA or RNA helicase